MTSPDGPAAVRPGILQQIGLALRQGRRERGESQRAFAMRTGMTKSFVAKLERAPGSIQLREVVAALGEAGYELVVVSAGSANGLEQTWEPTDLLARTRGGSRFPAHHPVRSTFMGPGWWFVDELWRNSRRAGPAPEWTAEGARVAGRLPRPLHAYGWGVRSDPVARDDGPPP